MRLLKLVVVLILAALIGLAGYAYFGDMEPARKETRQPISTGSAPSTAPAATTATDAPAGE